MQTPVNLVPVKVTTPFFGLGNAVRDALFNVYGIEALHEWQNEMIQQQLSQVGMSKNCLVLAPTSSGKTIVAVVVLLHNLLVLKRDSIYALPYKALVAEKVRELQNVAAKLSSFVVQVYAGFQGIFPVPVRRAHLPRLYIGTNEKLSLLWKFLCKEGNRRFEIGMIVYDEFHLIGDRSRGGVLEEFASSVLHWSGNSTRIIGLSATVGNPETIVAFLGSGNPGNCQVFEVNARPTEIKEHMVVLGSAFPIVRDAERRGTVILSSAVTNGKTNQSSSSSPSPYDMMGVHSAANDFLLPHHDEGAALWLKINQLKIFLSRFSTCKVVQGNNFKCLTFPPVSSIPEYVQTALQKPATSEALHDMTSLSVVDSKFIEAVCEVIEAGHRSSQNSGEVWTATCNKLQRLPDPYLNSTVEVRKADMTAWNFGIISNLVIESMSKKEGVLVFCDSRAKCVDFCRKVTICLQKLAR